MKVRLRTVTSQRLLSYLGKTMQVKHFINLSALGALSLLSANVVAGSLEQAKQLHDRIAGVAASETTLQSMATLLDDGKPIEAAYLAMETPAFYSTTLKLFATPWTNIEQDIFAPLNDYSATVIGAVRDDVDFREILQADMVYVGKNSLNLPAYNRNDNAHYQALEDQFIDLKDGLERTTQSSLNGLPSSATAGVLTSRAAAKEFFYLGTNRAMFRFTLMNHLCTDLEPLKDNTRSTDRIRQDVSRSPGGDSRLFINNCSSCHSGMDPLAQAFAYYNYEFNLEQDPTGESGSIAYNTSGQTDPDTGTRVQGKYHINSTSFPYGFVTPNDEWQNYWRQGPNQKLGWDNSLSGQGSGAKSLGQELANSNAFAQCQVKKVFKSVCLRDAESQADIAQISAITASFKQNAYQLKRVFAEVGNYCMGE
ncbi:hypothetical protein [Shewanella litoralis]|uniref:DUF1585 domain-containing protein n=1 Tax=Shewanella litoralis TaxID=2282700 RepID=A0ABQ2RDQ4_9GAMM|nr:hypothetical protein [Shewanella litoralis]GGQ26684.1 hypothetical protein GCM10009411_28290 [Shewanella litoralis]